MRERRAATLRVDCADEYVEADESFVLHLRILAADSCKIFCQLRMCGSRRADVIVGCFAAACHRGARGLMRAFLDHQKHLSSLMLLSASPANVILLELHYIGATLASTHAPTTALCGCIEMRRRMEASRGEDRPDHTSARASFRAAVCCVLVVQEM